MSKNQVGTKPQTYSDHPVIKKYEPVIGLEVHCQLNTETKLFCGCSTKFGNLPNQNTCPRCLGHPGTLPVLNEKAVEFGIALGLAVNATIHETSVFARKQYFYPDLPKGYQISQYDLPYCTKGKIPLNSGQSVTITRIHLEEDAGKNIHANQWSFVDLNRAGVPLLEVVSEPEIHSPEDAAEYLKRLRSIVRYLGISDGNLEEGSFRCDANVSIRPRGSKELNTRCEIKNLNSFKNIERALFYEIVRQADLLEEGVELKQQTLLFDPSSGKTKAMRSKEYAHDYRYFPDPDLGPLIISKEQISKIKNNMCELPDNMAKRFCQDYALSKHDADSLTSEKEIAIYFENVLQNAKIPPKLAANWILSELLRKLNDTGTQITNSPVSPESLAELLDLIEKGVISGKIAKSVFEQMAQSGKSAETIVSEKGLRQITDEREILGVIENVLNEFSSQVKDYQNGKEKIYGFFVGQIMKKSQGKLNPGLVNKILKEKLKK